MKFIKKLQLDKYGESNEIHLRKYIINPKFNSFWQLDSKLRLWVAVSMFTKNSTSLEIRSSGIKFYLLWSLEFFQFLVRNSLKINMVANVIMLWWWVINRVNAIIELFLLLYLWECAKFALALSFLDSFYYEDIKKVFWANSLAFFVNTRSQLWPQHLPFWFLHLLAISAFYTAHLLLCIHKEAHLPLSFRIPRAAFGIFCIPPLLTPH